MYQGLQNLEAYWIPAYTKNSTTSGVSRGGAQGARAPP